MLDQSMLHKPQLFVPFVYIIDSPSTNDLIEGYTIGMSLRDVLQAIKIPVIYTLAGDPDIFQWALTVKLQYCIDQFQMNKYSTTYPIIHLCMHGNPNGVILTNEWKYSWEQLTHPLGHYINITGFNPIVCMASCNGIEAKKMVNVSASVLYYFIANVDAILQADLITAYLTFYHLIFQKNYDIPAAVDVMKKSSADINFYSFQGEPIRQQMMQELTYNNRIFPFFSTPQLQYMNQY
jgi:hypothetical protein